MGQGVQTPPEISQKYRVFSNTGPEHLKTMPAFNVGPSSACQRNPISDDCPLLVVLGSSLPHYLKKYGVRVGPPLAKVSGFAHGGREVMLVLNNKTNHALVTSTDKRNGPGFQRQIHEVTLEYAYMKTNKTSEHN